MDLKIPSIPIVSTASATTTTTAFVQSAISKQTQDVQSMPTDSKTIPLPIMPKYLIDTTLKGVHVNLAELAKYNRQLRLLSIETLRRNTQQTSSWFQEQADLLAKWMANNYELCWHKQFGSGAGREKTKISLAAETMQTRLHLLAASRFVDRDETWTGTASDDKMAQIDEIQRKFNEWNRMWINSSPSNYLAFWTINPPKTDSIETFEEIKKREDTNKMIRDEYKLVLRSAQNVVEYWDKEETNMLKLLCQYTIHPERKSTPETESERIVERNLYFKILERAARYMYWLNCQLTLLRTRLVPRDKTPKITPAMHNKLKALLDKNMQVEPMSEWHTIFCLKTYADFMPAALRFEYKQLIESASDYRPVNTRETSLEIVMKTVMDDGVMRAVHNLLSNVELAKLYRDPKHGMWEWFILQLFGFVLQIRPFNMNFFGDYYVGSYHFPEKRKILDALIRPELKDIQGKRGPIVVPLLGKPYISVGIDTLYSCANIPDTLCLWLWCMGTSNNGSLDDRRECLGPLIQTVTGWKPGNSVASVDMSIPAPMVVDHSMDKSMDKSTDTYLTSSAPTPAQSDLKGQSHASQLSKTNGKDEKKEDRDESLVMPMDET